MPREPFKIWKELPVRWGDMDALGHVNNATYFVYLESARVGVFESLGSADFWQSGQGPILASVGCDFRRPVHYPATVEVGTRVEKIGNRSFHLAHGVFLAGEDTPVADARSVVVWMDYTANRPTPLPDGLRAQLEAMR